jgi:cell division inhibitor SepF
MNSSLDKVKDFFGFSEEPLTENTELNQAKKHNPFKISSTSQNTKSFVSSQIVIIEAKIYEDSLTVARHLREGSPVLVNLKFLDNSTGKRLIDFVCGTAFAINGHMLKIGENIFLFTPVNVKISNNTQATSIRESLEEISNKDFQFKQASA